MQGRYSPQGDQGGDDCTSLGEKLRGVDQGKGPWKWREIGGSERYCRCKDKGLGE